VLSSFERFLAKRLELRVNQEKSAVAKPQERNFLGFSFTFGEQPKIKLSAKALKQVKRRIKLITRRSRGISLEQMIQQLSSFLRGRL
jgi:RNA-directed DNA polymerase